MVLNTEKRRMLAEAASKLKACAGPSKALPTPTPASAPADLRWKGVVEAAASEDEDTCTGLVFKRKRGVEVAVSTHSVSDGCVPSFRENPSSASSFRDLVVHEGGGRMSLGAILECLPLLNCPLSSKRFSRPSKAGKWMARAKIPWEGMRPEALRPSSSHQAAPQFKYKNCGLRC